MLWNKEAVIEKTVDLCENKYHDIYYSTDIAVISGPFELFVYESFYDDQSVNDEDILNAFIKIYYLLNGEKELYELNEYEQDIYDYYLECFEKNILFMLLFRKDSLDFP